MWNSVKERKKNIEISLSENLKIQKMEIIAPTVPSPVVKKKEKITKVIKKKVKKIVTVKRKKKKNVSSPSVNKSVVVPSLSHKSPSCQPAKPKSSSVIRRITSAVMIISR